MEIPLSEDIVQRLKFFCEANGLGFSIVGTDQFMCILLGTDQLSVDQVSLIAAHLLLGGVINGEWNEANKERATKAAEESKEQKH